MRYILHVTTLLFLLYASSVQLEAGVTNRPSDKAPKAVTYDFSGGRFGDNLVSYLHGKWVAHVLNLPLLYRPFELSDQLVMHKEELWLEDFRFTYVKKFRKGMELSSLDRKGTLAVIPFFPEFKWEIKNLGFAYPHMTVNWDDEIFQKNYKAMIKPIKQVAYIDVPPGRISVAIHYRSARGVSSDQEYVNFTQRFLPLEYYVAQWSKLLEVLGDRPIYLHLFTDDPNPSDLITKFNLNVPNSNVIYGFRTPEEDKLQTVLNDFFCLANFDCIIRSDSNFSLCAALVGDVAIEMFPIDSVVEDNVRKVTEFGMKINPRLLDLLP